jgi:hypothetical protein
MLDWQKATYEDKLATCGDFIQIVWDKNGLRPGLQRVIAAPDDIKPYADGLVQVMDAFRPEDDEQLNQKAYAETKVKEEALSSMHLLKMLNE